MVAPFQQPKTTIFDKAPVKREMPKLDRRRFQRVKVNILGRLMLENRQEYPCQVVTMSPGDLNVTTVAPANVGERVVAYLDHIGRVEGKIVRATEGGFAFTMKSSARKQDKLANQLTWLANKHELNLAEDRRHDREAPQNPFTEITMANGDKHQVRILDMSLSGAAISLNTKLEVGSSLMLGRIRSRVVRQLEEGYALEFAAVQENESGLK